MPCGWHEYSPSRLRLRRMWPVSHSQHYYRQSIRPSIRLRSNVLSSTLCPGRAATRRTFLTDSLPTILVPPAVFTGLLLTLWTYKCIMTVMFQDKIIYMPYMPPFSRSEKIEDYATTCQPVQWKQQYINSLDRTRISICLGTYSQQTGCTIAGSPEREIIVCYFHGNGSSLPPRLPLLAGVLRSIEMQRSEPASRVRYNVIALSYRGYWTSSGRASQAGIEQDAQALLQWVSKQYTSSTVDAQLVLWGQSIGAGVASTAASTWLTDQHAESRLPIAGLVLETPFTSIKSMLIALYPQKWLPYRYLWPFLWNHWDTEVSLQRIAETKQSLRVLLLPATRDEVVPPDEADKLEEVCRRLQLPTLRQDVVGALHTNATIRRDGQDIVAKFIVDVSKSQGGNVLGG